MASETQAGAILVAGALLFLTGAALPTWRAFLEPDPGKRAAIIRDQRTYTILAHVLFSLGALLPPVAFVVLVAKLPLQTGRLLGFLGTGGLALGALAWLVIVYIRLATPPEEYVTTTAGAWTFPAYSILTLLGFGLGGAAMALSGFPLWLGIGSAALSLLILVVYFLRRDLPPALYYLVSLAMGIGLLLSG
jgi:hypothetical protein